VSTVVRWGVIGTAHINRRVVPALLAARRSALVAVASRDLARAAHYARQWDIPVAHASYDALLRSRDIDAVYIPLPNTLHVEWTLRALDAGKHVLCEKPLALTPDDIDRVDAVARDRQRVVAEGFMYRHEPLTAAVLATLAEGAIGPLRTITATFTFERSRTPDVRLDPLLGGGSLWDIGCYAVNVARLIAGREPVRVLGVESRGPTDVDESFSGILQFDTGVTAAIHSSFRAAYRTALEITGAQGVMRVSHPFKPGPQEQIDVQCGDDTRRIAVNGSPLLFVRMVEDFVAAVLDGRVPAVSLRDSRGNAAALAALAAAARTGSTVQL
jgi:xylose dehydrogenase (NAD/NADP)